MPVQWPLEADMSPQIALDMEQVQMVIAGQHRCKGGARLCEMQSWHVLW